MPLPGSKLPREKIKALSAHWEARQCAHEQKQRRKRTVRGGGFQYVDQCLKCGRPMTNPISRAKALEANGGVEPPPFDDALLAAWEQEGADGAKRIIGEYGSREEFERAEFFKWYDEYLASDVWLQKRQKVIQRAGGECEGCLSAPATAVHHLTYQHVGNEYLFELVAVCESCHDKLHEESELPYKSQADADR